MSRAEPRARASREEWAKRVERWKDSGLTAKEFASELGINAGTLQQWKYQFEGERRGTRKAGTRGGDKRAGAGVRFVELATPVTSPGASLEVHVGSYRVVVPAGFDAAALKQVLAVLETR